MFYRTMTHLCCLFLTAAMIACSGPGAETGPPPTPFWVDTAPADAVPEDTSSAVDTNVGVPDTTLTDSQLTDAGPLEDTAVADTAVQDTAPVDTGPVEEKAYYVSVRVNREMTQDPSPFGSSWAESLTASIGLVQVVWLGNVGTRWEQICTMWSNRVHGSQIFYGAPFLSAIPVEPVEITRLGGIYSEALDQVWLGLEKGYTGEMPELGEDDHEALVDSDDDSEPGVSLDIDMIVFGNQKIFVAQRSTTNWSAPVGPNGRIQAEPNVTHERVTLGATVGILVADTNSKPVSGKPADSMVWTPLEAPISCADLLNDPEMLELVNWPPSID